MKQYIFYTLSDITEFSVINLFGIGDFKIARNNEWEKQQIDVVARSSVVKFKRLHKAAHFEVARINQSGCIQDI